MANEPKGDLTEAEHAGAEAEIEAEREEIMKDLEEQLMEDLIREERETRSRMQDEADEKGWIWNPETQDFIDDEGFRRNARGERE